MTYQRQKRPRIETRLSPAAGPAAPGGILGARKRGLGELLANIAAWNRGRQGAARLQWLNAHMRADIGLGPADGDGDGQRKYWLCW